MHGGNGAGVCEGPYRCAPMMVFPVGRDSALLNLPLNRSTYILPSAALKFLRSCVKFASLDDHADRICSDFGLPRASVGSIKSDLEEHAARGLMISLRYLLDSSLGEQKSETLQVPRISALCIPTRDRVCEVERALESYIENTRVYGRTVDFVIADDSRSRNGNLCSGMLQSLTERFDLPIFYAGFEEKQTFARSLVAVCDVPAEVVQFALFGTGRSRCSVGANRNTLLLHNVGDLFLSVDDDSVCQVATPPGTGQNEALAFCAEADPTEFWFFPDRSSAMSLVSDRCGNLLALHERLLGQGLSSIVRGFLEPGPVSFDDACAHILKCLCSERGSVCLTYNGVLGDSGTLSPIDVTHDGEGTRRRLLNSEECYRSGLSSRDILRCVTRTTVCHSGPHPGLGLGIDNRILLPPFLPVERSEYTLFGCTVAKCLPDRYFGHLPYALVHDPRGKRVYVEDRIQTALRLRLCDIVNLGLASFQPRQWHIDPKENLVSLGKHLMEIGSLAGPEFEEVLRTLLCYRASQIASALESLLRKHQGRPDFWAGDVRKHEEVLVAAAAHRKAPLVAEDLAADLPDDEAQKLTQQVVFQFGQLIYWWPEVVSAAHTLRAQGLRVGRRIG